MARIGPQGDLEGSELALLKRVTQHMTAPTRLCRVPVVHEDQDYTTCLFFCRDIWETEARLRPILPGDAKFSHEVQSHG